MRGGIVTHFRFPFGAVSENCQNAQAAAFFALCRPIFPWNTSSIPAGKWLAQNKNPTLLVILPVFRCGLGNSESIFRCQLLPIASELPWI